MKSRCIKFALMIFGNRVPQRIASELHRAPLKSAYYIFSVGFNHLSWPSRGINYLIEQILTTDENHEMHFKALEKAHQRTLSYKSNNGA